jgi:hypothetical protein
VAGDLAEGVAAQIPQLSEIAFLLLPHRFPHSSGEALLALKISAA